MGIQNFYVYIIVFVVAVVIGLLLNRFFLTRQMGFLVKKANSTAIRWSSQSKPIFGGVGFFCLFILGMLAYLFIFGFETAATKEFISLLIVVTISFLMGLADDLISTPPFFKFIVQFLVAVVFIFNEIYIKISPHDYINFIITFLWVVGIMNSINMLDNMDAITGLVSLSIIGSIVVSSLLCNYMEPCSLSFFISLVLVASLISFMFYNWNPSKMYMGDNGSQILGSFLAFVGITYFWNGIDIAEFSYGYNTKQIAIVASAFIVPLTDTTTVTINRLLRKKSPFVGGRDHTTHHLYYLGLHERLIALLLFGLNCIGLFLAYTIIVFEGWEPRHFWLFMMYPIGVFLCLYSITKISKPKNK